MSNVVWSVNILVLILLILTGLSIGYIMRIAYLETKE